ncbi:GspE/PulE/PilB domain-containing protein, partial [Mycobacterium kansasii]
MLRESTLVVAMEDPWARAVLDEAAFMTNLRVLPVMAAPISLIELIEDAYDAMPRAKDAPGAPSIQ